MFSLSHDDPGLLDEHLARLGEPYVPIRSLKKLNAQFLFELPDLLAEWRLTDVQAFGRLSEMQRISDGDRISEVTQL